VRVTLEEFDADAIGTEIEALDDLMGNGLGVGNLIGERHGIRAHLVVCPTGQILGRTGYSWAVSQKVLTVTGS
jgi:hypothetical protein